MFAGLVAPSVRAGELSDVLSDVGLAKSEAPAKAEIKPARQMAAGYVPSPTDYPDGGASAIRCIASNARVRCPAFRRHSG
jgi:hypothetical protein